jgi:hypothetical protein
LREGYSIEGLQDGIYYSLDLSLTTINNPEAEFLVEKPGTKTGLLPGFFVFSSRHLLSGNARYFWSFASFSSRFLQFVSFSSCFEEGTRVSFSSRFVKSFLLQVFIQIFVL